MNASTTFLVQIITALMSENGIEEFEYRGDFPPGLELNFSEEDNCIRIWIKAPTTQHSKHKA